MQEKNNPAKAATPFGISNFVKSCQVAGGRGMLAMMSWPLCSSLMTALKQYFHIKKETNANYMTGEAEDVMGKDSCLQKQSAGLCFSALLPLPQTRSRCGWGPDATCPTPSAHVFAEGNSSSCHPILTKGFPQQKGEM